MKRLSADLIDLAIGLMALAIVVVVTVMGVAVSDWFTGVLHRAGFTSPPVAWIAHIVGCFVTIAAVLSVADRIVNGRFWFRE